MGVKIEELIPLERLITKWETQLQFSGFLLSPEQNYLIKLTIKYLKELRKIKEKEISNGKALSQGV